MSNDPEFIEEWDDDDRWQHRIDQEERDAIKKYYEEKDAEEQRRLHEFLEQYRKRETIDPS